MGSVGRRLSGYKQKALGRQTLKFAFDVVPLSVGEGKATACIRTVRLHSRRNFDTACAVAADVPTQYGRVSFVFQRGGSLQYTDAVHVDTERKAYWNEVLKLVGSGQSLLLTRRNGTCANHFT